MSLEVSNSPERTLLKLVIKQCYFVKGGLTYSH